jgi:hypothetical protein
MSNDAYTRIFFLQATKSGKDGCSVASGYNREGCTLGTWITGLTPLSYARSAPRAPRSPTPPVGLPSCPHLIRKISNVKAQKQRVFTQCVRQQTAAFYLPLCSPTCGTAGYVLSSRDKCVAKPEFGSHERTFWYLMQLSQTGTATSPYHSYPL